MLTRMLRSFSTDTPLLRAKTCGLAAGLLLVSVSIIVALDTRPAYACSATPTATPGGEPRPNPTLAERISTVDAVFEGTVLDNERWSFATVEVHRYFKGSGPATVEISGFGNYMSCRVGVALDGRYVFFASWNQRGELVVPADYWVAQKADEGTIASVMEAVAQDAAVLSITPTDVNDELPDLVVLSMSIGVATGNYCDNVLGLAVTIQNIGGAPASPFVVDFNGGRVPIEAGVLPEERLRLWLPGYAGGENTALADATSVVEELNEANNSLTLAFLPTPLIRPTCTPIPTSPPTATATVSPTPRPTIPSAIKILTTTHTPTPTATPSKVVVVNAEQPAKLEPGETDKDAPASRGACNAPVAGGSGVGDVSGLALVIGVVGLAARRKFRL